MAKKVKKVRENVDRARVMQLWKAGVPPSAIYKRMRCSRGSVNTIIGEYKRLSGEK